MSPMGEYGKEDDVFALAVTALDFLGLRRDSGRRTGSLEKLRRQCRRGLPIEAQASRDTLLCIVRRDVVDSLHRLCCIRPAGWQLHRLLESMTRDARLERRTLREVEAVAAEMIKTEPDDFAAKGIPDATEATHWFESETGT